jgi:Spy/CpxP family protein refolding chaperone
MIKFNPSTCALLFLSAALLGGQTAPPTAAEFAQRRVSHLTEMLSLNATQQSEAKTIFSNEANSTVNLHTSMASARKALQTAVETNDSGAIAAQATQIGNLTAQETQARATAEAAFYALLNAEQQAKFKETMNRGPGGRGPGHGPGDGSVPLPPGD